MKRSWDDWQVRLLPSSDTFEVIERHLCRGAELLQNCVLIQNVRKLHDEVVLALACDRCIPNSGRIHAVFKDPSNSFSIILDPRDLLWMRA